ncbi:TraM recognition domain-containing protein, partial [Arthrospira platensis SPKY1]|nr:TraM recognition domain-containing protein [Arthrospira platensis SPKY1]
QDFCLYVDEFQNFSTDSFASILSEARKYRLNLVVANQYIGQLSDQIRDAVLGNVGTAIAYRVGNESAEVMAKYMTPIFDEADLRQIPNYNCAMRMLIEGVPTQPFSMSALPPLGNFNKEL